MAIDIVTRFKGVLPWGATGGHDSAGGAQQNKTVVVGRMDITSYTGGGEPVTAANLGLKNLDCILLNVEDVDGSVATTTNIHVATYDYTAEQVLAWDGADFAVIPGTSAVVRFAAFGDSAEAPEFT